MSERKNGDGAARGKSPRGEAREKTRNAERFERQAQALRENLRRRNQQRRAGTDPASHSASDKNGD